VIPSLASHALDRLRGLPGLALRDDATRDAYRLDGAMPAAILLPETAEAAAQALGVAGSAGSAVVPWGAGLHQSLGCRPRRYDLALDLTRMNRILAYEPADMTISVEAGIRLRDLASRLAEAGQFLPLDPPGGDGATLGGVLAANLSGPLRCRYGTARDLVLGLRVAGPDGRLTFSGSRVVKNATAYDLPKLHIGAFGTLGLIVEATLRVYPRPAAEGAWWLLTDGMGPAQGLADRILASPLTPTRLELFDAQVGRALGIEQAGLLVSVAGIPEAVEDQGARLAALAAAAGGCLTRIADPAAAWAAVRDYPWPASAEARGVFWRGGVRPSACGDAVTLLRDRMPSGVAAGLLASASSGALRGSLQGDEGSLERAAQASRAVLEELGGYFVLLDAPATVRDTVEVWGGVPDGLDLMQRLRRAHDPLETLNPGRFIPGL
jgi:glycolate oxidase FAD binding subunit